jgi:dolichol-phosphate mannosyltransferase
VKAGAAIPARNRSGLLSVVIPCRNEEGAIASSVEHLYVELRLHGMEHEIVTVDDGSTDSTWQR